MYEIRGNPTILAEEAAWSNPDGMQGRARACAILAEEAAWSNPDESDDGFSETVILAEEAAWSNPDDGVVKDTRRDILAEEAAWSNPDEFGHQQLHFRILAEEAAWSTGPENTGPKRTLPGRLPLIRRTETRGKRPGFQRRPGGESPPKRTVRPRSLERSGSRTEQSGFKPPTGQSFPSVGFRTDRRADLSTLRKYRP